MSDQPLTHAEFDARESRLRLDIEDARKELNRARSHWDRLCEELRELRYARRQQLKDAR
ncbi:hypothetical protein [Kitasatospora sp. NPDC001175]|uniref:hypothetical protein n=1 Tax=Kitasatospora sp. NPDC001175 TaxID=3157103 RepID=UPI003D0680C2